MLFLLLALPHRFARNLQAASPHGARAPCSTARLLLAAAEYPVE